MTWRCDQAHQALGDRVYSSSECATTGAISSWLGVNDESLDSWITRHQSPRAASLNVHPYRCRDVDGAKPAFHGWIFSRESTEKNYG